MTEKDLPALSIADLQSLLRRREVSPREVIDALHARIEAVDQEIDAYLSFDVDAASKAADDANVDLPLGGVPLAIKDIINVKGQPCTCAAKILQSYRATYDATVIQKLREAGAIPFGKTNLDEFAMGSSTENSAMKLTRNPWDFSRVPGGSSGGSAAAVAADAAFGALGSDTGGSIRQPAALSGVVGMKPTYGRVSRYGLIAFASSLDQIGPFARSVGDAAITLSLMSGLDPLDATSSDRPGMEVLNNFGAGVKGMKLGIPREYYDVKGIEPGVKAAIDAALFVLRNAGAEIVDVSLPHTDYGLAAYYIIAPAECSSNLARFDGVRYGLSEADAPNITEQYMQVRRKGFGTEVRRRVMLGTYALSTGYYDAYYLKAQKVRTLIKRDFDEAFKRCDAIVSATSPTVAFPIGSKTQDPLSMYLCDVLTLGGNLAGLPGISVPCGRSDGLPVGLQVLGPQWGESVVLRVARSYEEASEIRAEVASGV